MFVLPLFANQAKRFNLQIDTKFFLPNLLETSNYFHRTVEVRHVPARKGNPQDARENGFAIFVCRLRDDEVRHPRADLQCKLQTSLYNLLI